MQEMLYSKLRELAKEATLEYRLRKPDGATLWVRSTGSAYPRPDGHIVVFGTTSDITDRKRTEEALRASEQKYRLFAENVSDMVWTIDFTGRFTYFSPSTRQILGYELDELVGLSFERILAPSSLDLARKTFAEGIARLKAGAPPLPSTLELEHLRKDGSATWLEVTVSRVCDESGRAIAFQGVSRDITERRRMADELRKAKEAAEAANHAKSEFLANMSHEIRTPMTAILGYADLVLDENVGRATREHVTVIKRNGEHLLRLIGDILDLSKIEAGKLQIELDALLAGATGGRSRFPDARAGRREASDSEDGIGRSLARDRAHRSLATAPGAVEPRGQRDQIHRARRGSSHRPTRLRPRSTRAYAST